MPFCLTKAQVDSEGKRYGRRQTDKSTNKQRSFFGLHMAEVRIKRKGRKKGKEKEKGPQPKNEIKE